MMEDKDIEIKDAPKALWDAPFALLSHEFGDSEAKYDYANKVCICCVCWGPGTAITCVVASPEGVVMLVACFAGRQPSHSEHGAEPCFPELSLPRRRTGLFTELRAGPGSSCLCLQAALDLFETQWDQLVGKPSTITSPENQQVRSIAGM